MYVRRSLRCTDKRYTPVDPEFGPLFTTEPNNFLKVIRHPMRGTEKRKFINCHRHVSQSHGNIAHEIELFCFVK